jgi:hypothetical protein
LTDFVTASDRFIARSSTSIIIFTLFNQSVNNCEFYVIFAQAKIPTHNYPESTHEHAKNALARPPEKRFWIEHGEPHYPMTCFHSSMKKVSLLFLRIKTQLLRSKQTSSFLCVGHTQYFLGIISSPPILTDSMPKSKFHHPDAFPEGGTSNLSTSYDSEQHARQFFQVVYLEN